MVMRGKNRNEIELLRGKVIEHRLRFAGIDDGGEAVVAHGPDVIVLECAQRNDLKGPIVRHWGFLRNERVHCV
jgi:hypothetical protein